MPDSHGYYRSSQVTISGPLENTIDARSRLMVSSYSLVNN